MLQYLTVQPLNTVSTSAKSALLPVCVLCVSVHTSPCRQQHLQFRPPLEEIRSKFYREMRRFIAIPLHFRGVGQGEGQLSKPQQTIFPRMIDRNAKGLLTVYRKVSGVYVCSHIGVVEGAVQVLSV